MDTECQSCGWHGDANELNWMVLENNAIVGGKRVCPECRGADVTLLT